jgi:plastocyanin
LVPRRALAAAGAALALSALIPAVAGAATRNAFAGGDEVVRNAPDQFSPNAFLRRTMTVHVGDTVRWRFRGFHTVTFPVRGEDPPGFIMPGQTRVTGVNDAAGQPFWFNNQVPTLLPNPEAAGPVAGARYDGTRLRNSGLPTGTPPRPYRLQFTRTGTFDYYCVIHPGMEGAVRVVSRTRRVPTEAQNSAAANRELARLVAAARRAAREDSSTANTVDVGRAPRGQRFTLNAFFPAQLSVKVGQPVTFTMAGQNTTEVHTVTFGPKAYTDTIEPLGPTGFNPLAAYPSDPPPTLPPLTPANHGNGFLNAGLLDNDSASPQPNRAAVTFGAPGAYAYVCLIHANMAGTVTVTP